MKELNDDNFAEEVYTTKKPILIEFMAQWCVVCREFDKKLEQLKKIYGDKVVFAKVDIDESFRLSSGFNIDKLPTFILYYKREPMNFIIGAANLSEFKTAIDEVIN